MPANADVMKNSKKVAVIDFHGDRDGIFTTKVESFFTNIRVQHKPYFAVVDPSMLDNILAEHFTVPQTVLNQAAQLTEMADIGAIVSLFNKIASSAPGLGNAAPKPSRSVPKPRTPKVSTSLPRLSTPSYVFRQTDAIRIGQLSGADTILTGVVKWPYVKRERYHKEKSECAKYERKENKLTPGIKSKQCVKYVKRKINCNRQISNIEFVIKAVSVNNNQITFTNDYSGQAKHEYCDDNKNATKVRPLKLSKTAMDNAIQKMRRDVAPYIVTLTIQLLDKDDSQLKENTAAKAAFDTALAFAKKGHLERACTDFHRAEQMYNESAAVYYNLGVCAEIKNDMELALQRYRHAEDLLKKPNKYVSQAFSRVHDRIEKEKRVQAQLR